MLPGILWPLVSPVYSLHSFTAMILPALPLDQCTIQAFVSTALCYYNNYILITWSFWRQEVMVRHPW